jgi:hypothetical protein
VDTEARSEIRQTASGAPTGAAKRHVIPNNIRKTEARTDEP